MMRTPPRAARAVTAAPVTHAPLIDRGSDAVTARAVRVTVTAAVVLLAVAALAPEAARACAACGFGEDESRSAYIVTTVALSVLPLTLIATLALWLRHAHKRRTAEHAETKPR